MASDSLVLQQVQLAALPDPTRQDLEFVQRRIRTCIETNQRAALVGLDRTVWGDPDTPKVVPSDLFVLRSRSVEDPFTAWTADKVLKWLYQRIWCRVLRLRGKEGDDISLKYATLLRATSIIATAIAAMLPVSSIVALSYVSNLKVRLALIAAFTFLSALSLLCFTAAKRTDIFTATSA